MFHSLSVLHSCLKYTYIYINKKIYVCVYFFFILLYRIYVLIGYGTENVEYLTLFIVGNLSDIPALDIFVKNAVWKFPANGIRAQFVELLCKDLP